jgi:hypothetical protein
MLDNVHFPNFRNAPFEAVRLVSGGKGCSRHLSVNTARLGRSYLAESPNRAARPQAKVRDGEKPSTVLAECTPAWARASGIMVDMFDLLFQDIR